MASAGSVVVDFRAEVQRFQAQLKQVQGSLNRLEGGFKSFERVAKTALGFFSVGIATNFIRSAANAADALGKTADKLGVSTERLTAFELAAQDAGVETATLSKLLTDAQRRLGEASFGTGEAAKTLKSLGLNVAELERLSPDELFLRYSDAIGKLNTRSEQFAVATDLFGRSAEQAFTLIEAGRPAIEQATATVEKLGLALSRVEIKQIEAANDKLGLLGRTSQATGQQIAASLAPYVEAIADSLLNSGVAADTLRSTIDQVAATGYVGFQVLRNGALALESAFFAVAGAGAKILEQTTKFSVFGLLNRNLVDSFGAAADANLAKSAEALNQIKSFAQIQEGLMLLLEQSKARAEASVAETQAKIGNLGIGGDPQVEAFNASLALKEELELSHYGRLLEIQRQYNEASAELTRELDEGEFVRHQRAREAAVIASEQIILQQRQAAFGAAAGLLQALAGRSKAAAIASVALNKALSIAQAIQNTGVAATRALASVPYPANLAAAAQIKAYGALEVAAIAATGLAEIGQIRSSSAPGAPLGSPTNPVFTNGQDGEQQVGAAIQPATQIFINGYISQDVIDDLVEQLKDRDRRGVVIFSGGGNQANAIRRGT